MVALSDFLGLSFVTDTIDDLLNLGPSSVKGNFISHSIEVIFDSKKMSLYVDGEILSSINTYLFPRSDIALMRGILKENGKKHIIEVFGISGIFSAKIKVCVDGNKIAGPDF